MLIIGDIAGQYKTLVALLKQCPDDEPISVGDMVDRGPDSKSVLDFFMSHGRAIYGNHEDMMLEAFHPQNGMRAIQDWFGNGGAHTLNSFGIEKFPISDEQADSLDPYLAFIDSLPFYIREPGLLITHAPVGHIEPSEDLAVRAQDREFFIWNRDLPYKRPGEFQVFGHNSRWGLRYIDDYAVCIDTSHQKILTGLQWPSMKVFQQPYIA